MRFLLTCLTSILLCVACAEHPEPIDQRSAGPTRILMPEEVFIFPNQTFFLATKLEGSKVVILEQLKTKPKDQDFIEIKYEKMGGDALLMISNPYELPLKFHANLVDVQGRHRQTSSCAISPKASNFEQWPGIIFKISLSDFHLVRGKNEDCVY